MEEREYSFYGFHGTAESCSIGIEAAQSFNYGTPREDHWLGQGAYFFKDDELQAELWAKNKVKNHETYKGQKPYVVEVYIKVSDSRFLNLDSRVGLTRLESFLENLENQGLLVLTGEDENTPDKVRCFILSLLPEFIWVIQRTFDVKSKFDDNLKLKEMDINLHGTQICVRDNEAIVPGSIKTEEIKVGIQRPLRKTPRLF